MSIATLIISCAVFSGASFAWFSAAVSNTGNRIQASSTYVTANKDATTSESPVLLFAASSSEWMPGERYTADITLRNEGTMDMDCYLSAWIVSTDGNGTVKLVDDAVLVGDGAERTSLYAVQSLEAGSTKNCTIDVALTNDICNALANKDAELRIYLNAFQRSAEVHCEPFVIDGMPYRVVSSAEDLTWIATQVSEGVDFSGTTFALCSDIVLTGAEALSIGSSERPFKGSFDGNDHAIYQTFAEGTTQIAPLFAVLGDGASVLNLRYNVTGFLSLPGDSSTAFLAGAIPAGAAVWMDDVTVVLGSSAEARFLLTSGVPAGHAAPQASFSLVGSDDGNLTLNGVRLRGWVWTQGTIGIADGAVDLVGSYGSGVSSATCDSFCLAYLTGVSDDE